MYESSIGWNLIMDMVYMKHAMLRKCMGVFLDCISFTLKWVAEFEMVRVIS